MINDAASSAEIAYMLLKDNPEIEKDMNQELKILIRMITFNTSLGNYDKALAQATLLLELN